MTVEFKLGTVLTPTEEEVAALFVGPRIFSIAKLIEATASAADSRQDPQAAATVLDMLGQWDAWEPRLRHLADSADAHPGTEVIGAQLRPPVTRPGKVLGLGANYRDHLEEMGDEGPPADPYVFLKPASTTQIGSGQSLEAPRQVEWLDWEAELAIVIGRRASHVSVADASAAIAGYAVANDVSARDSLSKLTGILGVNWLLHKGFDGFTPIGPAMTPAAFVTDPEKLEIKLWVNGELKQSSNTSQMIVGVRETISHLSQITTLEPGDVILTGTPAGVGFAREPRETLRPGDLVTIEIEGLGRIETPVIESRYS